MSDIILEILRALIVASVLAFMALHPAVAAAAKIRGWIFLRLGFGLVFFGMLIDITDNFPALNRYVVIGDTVYQAFLEKVAGYLLGFLFLALGFWKWLPGMIAHERRTREALKTALGEIKVLSGLLPICSHCKKIRDDHGYWNQIESYIRQHSEADFTHSLCPHCRAELYPGTGGKTPPSE
jgi:hypothetical protein